jgi:hypothetical protein
LFLDSDTLPYYSDALVDMLKWEKDVISGLYFYKNSAVPVVLDLQTKTNMTMEKMAEIRLQERLEEIEMAGFGVILISRKVFLQCEFDYDVFGEERTDDFGYCHVIRERGFKLWFDPKIVCKHLRPNPDFDDMKHNDVKMLDVVIPTITPETEKLKTEETLKKNEDTREDSTEDKNEGMDAGEGQSDHNGSS